VGDFDQNGDLEIVVVSTVAPLEAYIYVLGTNHSKGTAGSALVGWPQMVPGKSESSPVVGDVDGDGFLDVIFGIGGSHQDSPNNLYAFKITGSLVDGFPITLDGPIRSCPFICDLDQDGDVDIVYGGWDLQIHVWDMPFRYHSSLVPWPTFRGNLCRDGVYRWPASTNVPDPIRPDRFVVVPPFPNPFNPSVTVKLYLPSSANFNDLLQVNIFDLKGRRLQTLYDGPAKGGWHKLTWDGADAGGRSQASGLYFLQARCGGQIRTEKISLIK
jgi:hypothetical protein